jgi:hypothetical protein
MCNGSAAECVVTYDAPDVAMERSGSNTILRLKAIPWARILVDTLLVAGILLASSSFLSVR